MKIMYFDNAATTKVDDNVASEMQKYFLEEYGNASSVHTLGREAKIAIEKARDVIASSINAKSEEIFFTSGGTEANNFALKGLFFMNKKKNTGKKHIITTKIEHDCILNTCKWLESQGAKITYLDVDKDGLVNPKDVENAITKETFIVSIIHGNNEIGTLQALEEIGKICREKGVYFHIDACQSYTKTDINVKKQNLDLVTLNAHKIHGPKGVGALYIREGIEIEPFFHGGGHEHGKRSGTENVPGIVGFARAVRNSSSSNIKKMIKMRDRIIEKILEMPNTRLNGVNGEKRLCNNINVSFKNIEGESIGSYLEAYGILTSTGSACASHSLKKSHVLKALGLNDLEINSSVRITISKNTTEEEVDYLLEKLEKVVEKLRKISPISIDEDKKIEKEVIKF